jgi:hypothetical protein
MYKLSVCTAVQCMHVAMLQPWLIIAGLAHEIGAWALLHDCAEQSDALRIIICPARVMCYGTDLTGSSWEETSRQHAAVPGNMQPRRGAGGSRWPCTCFIHMEYIFARLCYCIRPVSNRLCAIKPDTVMCACVGVVFIWRHLGPPVGLCAMQIDTLEGWWIFFGAHGARARALAARARMFVTSQVSFFSQINSTKQCAHLFTCLIN